MTVTEGGELYCMGYAAFRTKYHECASAWKVTFKDVHELERKSMMEDNQSRLELGDGRSRDGVMGECAYFDTVSEGEHTMPDVSDKKI